MCKKRQGVTYLALAGRTATNAAKVATPTAVMAFAKRATELAPKAARLGTGCLSAT